METTCKIDIINAKITRARLGFLRGTFLTINLTLDYSGSGQGYGGYVLDKPPTDKSGDRLGTAYGCECIIQLMRILDVEQWQDLEGQLVRVRREAGINGKVQAIGHPLKEQWFSFEQVFEDNCTNSAPRSEPKIQIRGEDIANTPIFLRSFRAEIIASDFDSES